MESKVLAVIPARSGSKSVKDKNIRLINGIPMLAYSIEHAIKSQKINRLIVSTDSAKYAEIAIKHGGEVPFLRPKEIAGDSTPDIAVFEHVLKFLKENENYVPAIIVHLRPTYPIRNVEDIDKMIQILIDNPDIDSIRSIAPAKEIAYKMWRKDEDGIITPILTDIPEAYNMPRQKLPEIYYQNACIDVLRSTLITEMHSMSGKKIMGYALEHNFDIDTEEDFKNAENYLSLASGGKTFVFDIDGVIAEFRADLNYNAAEPNKKNIKIVNQLYERGNHIVLFTARGYKSGINWEKVTVDQLHKWGLKYHEIKFGKPAADYYIDDKMLNLETIYQFFA